MGRVDTRSACHFVTVLSCFLFLVQDLKGLGYEKGKPVGPVGVTELSDAQKKQLNEQQEMQQMYGMMMQHKHAMQDMQFLCERVLQQPQHGYDSDEEVDSELGTWDTSCDAWRWTRYGSGQSS